jgi:formylmethanofuran:tetrahydromethanopterin formyltransferase
MGAVLYSLDIKIYIGAIELWELLEQKHSGTKTSTKKIRRLMKVTGEMTAFNQILVSIEKKLGTAKAKYKKLKKQSFELRVAFGTKLMAARAKERNTTVEVQKNC